MIEKNEMITFKLVPDRTVTNRRAADLMRAIHDFHQSIRRRISFKDKKIRERLRFFWDIVITAEDIGFYCTIPKNKASFVKQQLEITWDHSAIKEGEIEIPEGDAVDLCEMGLNRHNIFSLKVDRRIETEPLGSILISSKEMKEGDWARIQIMTDPISRINWQDSADKHHKTFKSGRTPRRFKVSKRDALLGVGEAFCFVMEQAADALDTVLDVAAGESSARDKELRDRYKKADDNEKRMILIDGGLSTATNKKRTAPTFRSWIRIMAGSEDKGRRESIVNTLTNGFHDLNGDNELEKREISPKGQRRIRDEVETFSPSLQTLADPDAMILSNMELGRLVELPSAALQDQYSFESINKREIQIPDKLKEGIPWGVINYKGKVEKVCLPIKNWGLLCRPQVIIGKMGTGKTTLGARLGAYFPAYGFTSIVVDTADGSLVNEARDALPDDFPESHIIDLDFADLAYMPPSDWSEMTSAMDLKGKDWDRVSIERRKAANRLTAILIDFIDKLATHETTDRMERYLSAVAKAILTSPDRGIMEVVLCLTNDEYREKVLTTFKITDPIVYGTIEELHNMSQDSRIQIVKSIMSRINVLISDDYLRATILQTPKKGADGKPIINVRRWIDGDPKTNPKYNGAFFVGIRIPKSELMETATDRLATFWDAKVWLSALSRYDLPSKNGCHGRPFVYIRDEPHQTPSSFKIHNDACREARKWGMKNVWLAHKLEDFDFMRKTLKDAGAQYSLYSTSKESVRSLKEELDPFTEEDLLKIPEQHVAVHKFAEFDKAFLCEMPRIQTVKDRSEIRRRCSEKYGRPLSEIEAEIFKKTRVLMSNKKGGN